MTTAREQRAARLGWGTVVSGVGHVALAVIGAVAALDGGPGASATAFWLWVVLGGVGLGGVLVLRADLAPAIVATPPRIGLATTLTIIEFFLAVVSAFIGANPMFLVVPLLLIGTNLMAMSAIRALARSSGVQATPASPL